MNLILKRLSQIEMEHFSKPNLLEANSSIKLLLNEVDFITELIPYRNFMKFKKLLEFIKGCKLTPNEDKIAIMLIEN